MAATLGRSIRLLVAGIQWPPETFLSRILRGLPREGIEVILGCAGEPDESWRSIAGITFVPTPAWSGPRVERAARLLRWTARAAVEAPGELRAVMPAVAGSLDERARRLNRLLPLLGHRADVVYFPWNLAAVQYEGLFNLGKPVVISCRGTQVNVDPYVPGLERIGDDLRRTFAKAAAVHCVSDHIREEACHFGLDAAKSRVIRPSVDTRDFRPGAGPSRGGPLKIVTTGALIWRKGIEYLLMALRLLRDRAVDVELIVIGDGNERDRAEFTARDLGLEACVRFAGKLPPAEVLATLQTADAFVLSSLSEGISNAVLEAMACGLAVVTTDCGGMLEAIVPDVEGLIVPVRDPVAMADALGRLAASPDLRRKLGSSARERVVRDFDLAHQVKLYAELFRSVA